MLILHPEQWINFHNSFRAFYMDNKSFGISVRSSANIVSFIVLLSIFKSVIFFHILFYLLELQVLR